ncbi:MAG: 4-alpha-glucanotransferase [Clostridia bacterium]
MRRAGVLMPIFSLPSEYGIGDFGRAAYKFIDFLKSGNQKVWQILPLGCTSYGDSPYQSFSTFAGNPYFIDLESLVEEGILEKRELAGLKVGKGGKIDYGKLYKTRYEILLKAFLRVELEKEEGYNEFCEENKEWLEDFALFMAVKRYFGGISWLKWDIDIRNRRDVAVEWYKEILDVQVSFHKYLQYTFYKQWKKLREYANENGVLIMGDMPIYVALDSADVWSHKELFMLDEKGVPKEVAGCPPDCFSELGQLWGNPIYRWDRHRETGYSWWIERIRQMFRLYNMVRIDHFLGFENYYSIPYGDTDARGGQWVQGPSLEIFIAIKNALGTLDIIAEDLGIVTDNVKKLLRDTGFPGMRVLHFGIFSREDSYHLPQNYQNHCVAYTGTHDNETLYGAYKNVDKKGKKFANSYLGIKKKEDFVSSCIRCLYASVAETVVVPMQDYLELDNTARVNTPSTENDNWQWRIDDNYNSGRLVNRLKRLTKTFSR